MLQNNFAAHAERHEWFVVQIEAQPSPEGRKATRQKLARAIEAGARRLRAKPAWGYMKDVLGSIGSFNVTLGFTGVSATLGTTAGRADSGNLDIDLEELVEDLARAMAGDNDEASSTAQVATRMTVLEPAHGGPVKPHRQGTHLCL